ncbi:divergent PAP2 family protein [Vibrio sp. 10N.286.52.C3]|uniref:divergent PAP2 family protein n=1 Tax=Vibrio sp. 10N.286.52.C3 TaxID=3229713 RepID=UPI0035515F82
MDISYVITPFFAWLIAGSAKFIVNSISLRRFAFDLIGYGGMPSNHSCIVSSVVAIIFIKEGVDEPVLVVAIALAFIVMLDANSLRQHIGRQSKAINILSRTNYDIPKLKERMGHTRKEIFIGAILGILSASIINLVFTLF